jgi:FSR family fosmidomycin resistance protein-like MFS transporter
MIESTADTRAAQPDRTFHSGQVLSLAMSHFVHDVFSAFLAPLLPLIIDKLSLSLTLAGSLSIYLRLPSLLNPLLGTLADRVDLRWFVILAPGVTAVAMSLLGVAPSYVVLALLLLVAGSSSACLHVPGPVLVAQSSGERVGKGMGFWMMGGELARTVGPLCAVGAVSWLTLEGSWPVMVVGIATSALIYRRIRQIPLRPPSQTHNALGQTWRAMRRVFLPLIGILLGRTLMRGALTMFLPTFLEAEGQSLWFGGIALAVLEFSGAVGALLAGTLSDRLGRRRVLFVSMGTAPLFMWVFLLVKGGWVLPALVLIGLADLSTTPVVMAIVQERAGDRPATANGIYMGISFVIGAIGPVLVGGLADRVGLRTAFVWSTFLALLSAPLIYWLPGEGE